MTSPGALLDRLAESEWQGAADEHRQRIDELLERHPSRYTAPDVGDAVHPVWGFMFTYYSFRPAQLRRWHPGFGVGLQGRSARRHLDYRGYVRCGDLVTVGRDFLDKRRETIDYVVDLLSATAERTPRLNCFGMHEWAMVYQSSPEQIRHAGVPLRLSPAETDEVVRTQPPRCTHFDAFRFFTPPARPLNLTVLNRRTQPEFEQPGCLHAGMDLYKWSYKLAPLLPSDVIADAFDLALHHREIDMRASPYDLSEFGMAPIQIEEPAGRAEYIRVQSGLARRAQALRADLIERCRRLSDRTTRA
jgi:hypothetical protein